MELRTNHGMIQAYQGLSQKRLLRSQDISLASEILRLHTRAKLRMHPILAVSAHECPVLEGDRALEAKFRLDRGHAMRLPTAISTVFRIYHA